VLGIIPSAADIINFIQGYFASWGYWFVFFGSFLENTIIVGLFTPGGTINLLGGFYAKLGVLYLPWVILAGWAGMFLGDNFDYWVGRKGQSVFQARHTGAALSLWLNKQAGLHPKLAAFVTQVIEDVLGVKSADFGAYFQQGHRFLLKHGGKAVFISHIFGHIRSVVCVSAGAVRLPYAQFLAYDLPATLLWAAFWISVGYFIGHQRDWLEIVFNRFGLVIVGLVLVYIAYRLVRGHLKRSRHARSASVNGE
jgi:membrane-associated protein